MSATQQEAQGGLLEALLQQVLGQVQGLSAAVAGQGRALDALSAGLGAVQGRLGNVEALQGELGGKLDGVQAKFQTLEAQQGELGGKLDKHEAKLDASDAKLEAKLEAVRCRRARRWATWWCFPARSGRGATSRRGSSASSSTWCTSWRALGTWARSRRASA